MELSRPPVLAKKLWKIVRIMLFMIRKGISKSKMMVDLHNLMMKRGKVAGKAIGNLMFNHHSSFSCRSDDAHSFVAPREYEFSCSNSPAFPFHKRKHHHTKHHHHYQPTTVTNDDVTAVTAVHKLLEMLNNDITTEASPVLPGFGFGKSPIVRQLRITDSPFPLKDAEEDNDNHVDIEAEEFIERFYQQLRLQKNMSTSESRNRSLWARSSG